MKNAICTIVTKSYLPWSLSLAYSVNKHTPGIKVYVLVTDLQDKAEIPAHQVQENAVILTCADIEKAAGYGALAEKYATNPNVFRWTLKTVLMKHLLNERQYAKVLYFDSDMYVYSDIQFLFEYLDTYDFLVTPHWINPHHPKNLAYIHQAGTYNAGFMGANKQSMTVLDWLQEVCLYRCDFGVNYFNADQGYLDLIPIYFEKVLIIAHKGCNVAYWNADYLARTREGSRVWVEDPVTREKFPLVFYHFASSNYAHFFNGPDKEITAALEELNASLQRFGYKQDLVQMGMAQSSGKFKKKLTTSQRLKKYLMQRLPYRIYRVQ